MDRRAPTLQPESAQHPDQASGADAHLQALKDSFKSAANSLTTLYKQSSHSYNVAYTQGRTDAYEEVFAWLTQQGQLDPSQKNVSVQRFKEHMQAKLNESKFDGDFQVPTQPVTVAQAKPFSVEAAPL